MTLILDAGGVSALAADRDKLAAARRRNQWPPEVPAAVLVEALTGDPGRDSPANRLVRTCLVVDVDERLGRVAARLRTATRRAGTISAVDAIVVAVAQERPDPVVLTSDPLDIGALAEHASRPVRVRAV